jgi:hypothetical protein
MGIKEGDEVQAKGIGNIFNKVIVENLANRHGQNRTSPQHIIAKTISTENKEKILKAVRKENQITYLIVNPSKL